MAHRRTRWELYGRLVAMSAALALASTCGEPPRPEIEPASADEPVEAEPPRPPPEREPSAADHLRTDAALAEVLEHSVIAECPPFVVL